MLLLEVDGIKEGLEEQAAAIVAIAEANHAKSVRVAQTAQERERSGPDARAPSGRWAG